MKNKLNFFGFLLSNTLYKLYNMWLTMKIGTVLLIYNFCLTPNEYCTVYEYEDEVLISVCKGLDNLMGKNKERYFNSVQMDEKRKVKRLILSTKCQIM